MRPKPLHDKAPRVAHQQAVTEAPFNLYGLALLAGGAALSVGHYRQTKGGTRRVWANLLILIGVLVIGAAGAATKGGATEILLYAELAGLVLMALGVYVAG